MVSVVRPAPRHNLPGYARPPGSVGEGHLLATCERCGECKTACPHGAIVELGPEYGSAAKTPAIDPEHAPCRLCADLPCATACPTEALRPVPLRRVAMGRVVALPDLCWAARGQPCDYCVTACPLPTAAIAVDGAGPHVDPDRCVGCGACIHYCTALPRALAFPVPR